MIELEPMETLVNATRGEEVDLPSTLRALYGRFLMPAHPDRPHAFGNFVTTLDGVTSLNEHNLAGGGEISGFNRHDQMVMGILRSVADAVVVGAGTLRAVPRHLWTAEHVFAPLKEEYAALRIALGKTQPPLNVIVSGRGDVDLRLPVFTSDQVPALVVTTEAGAGRLRAEATPSGVHIAAVPRSDDLSAKDIVDAVLEIRPVRHLLVEGGPHLMGVFLAEGALDELFLTLAPQIAGRTEDSYRPGLAEGVLFAPHRPLWASLSDVRRAASHLFLRYSLEERTSVQ